MSFFSHLFKKAKPETHKPRDPEPVKRDSGPVPEWKNDDLEIARAAVMRISDQEELLEIVRGKNYAVEIEAQKQLIKILRPDTEQDVLFEIADSFGFVPLRVKAASMLRDRDLLEKVAGKKYFLGEDINEAAKKQLRAIARSEGIAEETSSVDQCKAGDIVVFGTWEGDPLYWKVLAAEDDRVLLLTKETLGRKAYHTSSPATWDKSRLRADLNGDWFYLNPQVFSPAERERILSVTNDSPGIHYQNQTTWEECYANAGAEAEDHVFLLSCLQARKYFPGNEILWRLDTGLYKFYSSEELAAAFPWWLRNATRQNSAAVVVTTDGVINCCGFTVTNDTVPRVRPAMWVSRG